MAFAVTLTKEMGSVVTTLEAPPADARTAEPNPAPVASLETAVVRRAAAGDARAFRRLFEAHAPSLRRFLGDLLRDDAAADEATQEAFVRAHARLGSLRDDQKFAPWLFAIARHVFNETVRDRRRHPVASDERLAGERDEAPTPEGHLIGREAEAHLVRALADLDEDRRAVILLRIDHGLDYQEIASIMNWTLAKVKNEIHRGRLSMREGLRGYVGGPDERV